MSKLFYRVFTSTWLATEEESRQFRLSAAGKKFDSKLVIISVVVCLSLVFIEYFAKNQGYYFLSDLLYSLRLNKLAGNFTDVFELSSNPQLTNLAYWVTILAICYLIIPIIVIKFILKEKIKDYGLFWGNITKDLKLYFVMLLIMIPLVWYFSRTEGFQFRYPFYRVDVNENLWPNFWIWQALYLFQFFCLEFFFRGFMVHGLKKRFGFYSVFVMTIPYCMIHFGKPMPETIAAIIAGIVLGTFSLKSRTIWMGVIIHYSVAILMDLAALFQKGYFN